jgi:glycine C-acetyltransferase/8-amino-7-oxononanoate synthase
MFEIRLDELAARHLTRRLTPLHSGVGPVVEMAGRQILLLASNDYLGLAMHPEVVQSATEATQRFGAGAGASRLISGSLPPHQELESALAQFKGTEAALTFGSGYLANIGTIPALIGQGGLILADRLCHASLIDGCRLSAADFRIYRHNDTSHLQSLLAKRRRARRTLIVTDGVFSMDGDLAPLPELSRLAQDYEADIYIDDAHGTGVMGKTGRGTHEHYGMPPDAIDFYTGTLGKALGGGAGGYIAGSRKGIEMLIQRGRPTLFSNALPVTVACSANKAIEILMKDPQRVAKLRDNVAYARAGIKKRIGPLAYIWAGLKALTRPQAAIHLSSESKSISGELAVVSNGKFYGGKFTFCPEAKYTDGLLDVCVFPKVSLGRLPIYSFAALTDRLAKHNLTVNFQAQTIRISSAVRVPIQLDGEAVGHLPATIRVHPRTLRMVVP